MKRAVSDSRLLVYMVYKVVHSIVDSMGIMSESSISNKRNKDENYKIESGFFLGGVFFGEGM